MEKDERLLLASIEDKARRCQRTNAPQHTGFLSLEQCAAAEDICRGEHYRGLLYGGYEDAERRVMIFLPDYMDEEDIPGQFQPLSAIRAELSKGAQKLSHRDYLGALLGLGVERSVIGDILVRDDGADIIVLAEMADFFVRNFEKAGRMNLHVSQIELDSIKQSYVDHSEITDTVASLRLDNLISSAFRLSRGAAQEAVRQGLVSVNGRQSLKADMALDEGDKLVLRGKGKAVLKEVGGRSRKDRIIVTIDKYK